MLYRSASTPKSSAPAANPQPNAHSMSPYWVSVRPRDCVTRTDTTASVCRSMYMIIVASRSKPHTCHFHQRP